MLSRVEHEKKFYNIGPRFSCEEAQSFSIIDHFQLDLRCLDLGGPSADTDTVTVDIDGASGVNIGLDGVAGSEISAAASFSGDTDRYV